MSDLAIGGIWLAFVFILLGAQACAFGVAGGKLLEPLDRYGDGFALGFLLGPVGLVIAWAMRANGLLELERKERPHAAAPAPPPRNAKPSTPTAPRPPKEPRRFK